MNNAAAEGPQFEAVQNSPQRLGVVKRVVASLARGGQRRARVLEIGSYEGGSALALSAAVAEYFPDGGSVLCIDPWVAYLTEEEFLSSGVGSKMLEDFTSGEVFRRFEHNIKFADPRAPITYIRGCFADVAWRLQDQDKFDLIYIDGDHRYVTVCEDIAAARTLLALGGVLCGDDLEMQLTPVPLPAELEQVRAVLHLDYAIGYHPGVTLAVWEAFGGPVWCEAAVWAVRKGRGGEWITQEVGL